MSCCNSVIAPSSKGSSDVDYPVQDTDILPGESMDCFMQRSGNTTGKMDDKTDYVPNKILNTDIPLLSDGSVGPDSKGTVFKMTPFTQPSDGSATERVPIKWEIDNSYGATFTSNGATASLSGKFATEYFDKKLQIKVSAFDGTGLIDERLFTLSPTKASSSDTISFTHPLPGSTVTSKFGPRRPPASGASSQHGGADFAYGGGKVADVVAAADGTVIFTGFQAGGAGNYIKIKHNNANNKHLCTTVYMHLAKIYVANGQTVVKGQKIGLEGNTGIGTGAHLHFECRLPNGTKIDPVPLINGETTSFNTTDANNNGTGGTETINSNAVLTTANVQARTQCPDKGMDYIPGDDSPNGTQGPVPTTGDPFLAAWDFTMSYEVGPFWKRSMEDDPEVIAGLIDTKEQRRKCGYVNTPDYPGGETKFGIAQGPNPRINVRAITYPEAKATGFNNYWKRGGVSPESLRDSFPKTAIALFDMNYLHGVGNTNTIRRNAGITGTPSSSESDDDLLAKVITAQQAFMQAIVTKNPSRQKYINGWLARSNALKTAAGNYTKGT